MATKMAEPRIDQTMGNRSPPMLTAKSSGKPIAPASQLPSKAPIKPRAMDTRQPPRLYPAIACPTEPQIPATSNKIKKDSMDIIRSPHRLLHQLENTNCLFCYFDTHCPNRQAIARFATD